MINYVNVTALIVFLTNVYFTYQFATRSIKLPSNRVQSMRVVFAMVLMTAHTVLVFIGSTFPNILQHNHFRFVIQLVFQYSVVYTLAYLIERLYRGNKVLSFCSSLVIYLFPILILFFFGNMNFLFKEILIEHPYLWSLNYEMRGVDSFFEWQSILFFVVTLVMIRVSTDSLIRLKIIVLALFFLIHSLLSQVFVVLAMSIPVQIVLFEVYAGLTVVLEFMMMDFIKKESDR